MTIAQQLKIKDFPFDIKDKNGNVIYFEDSDGFWWKREFDSNGNKIYYENSTGFWVKRGFDSNGNQIYFENSGGEIIDNRPKPVMELTLDEIAIKFNIPVEQLKIKK
jgi:hypothetical protein